MVAGRVAARFARAGETINVPANAPHAFTNPSGTPARLLCLCAPAGRTSSSPWSAGRDPDPGAAAAQPAGTGAFIAKSQALAPQFKTELLRPPGRD
ncbi:MAG TPA: hypothetical protein VGH27_34020 [Streptosporangiaceae bacterium]